MNHFNESDGYRLMRNSASSCRLNAQHYLWKHTCGFNLHPRIPIPLDKELRIADIGTGTGIWIADTALGQAFRIDGFDKSLEQCPAAELLPKACSVRRLDVLQDLPADLNGEYDVINVRLIQGGLGDDPVPALRNFIAMLKPGGYLQWQEIDLRGLVVATAKAGLNQSVMEELLKEVYAFEFGRWVPRLAKTCAESGLLDPQTHRYRVPSEICVPFCQTQFGAYEEISRVSMDNSSPDSKGPRLRALIENAHVELRSGVWLDHNLEVTVARKVV